MEIKKEDFIPEKAKIILVVFGSAIYMFSLASVTGKDFVYYGALSLTIFGVSVTIGILLGLNKV